ncbi:MAG: VWA domain-containing protein [Pseudomonadota bacterium]
MNRPTVIARIVLSLITALLASAAVVGAEVAPADVILVIDNSGSMKKNDPEFLAKQAVSEFVAGLEPGNRLGIILFDEQVRLTVPLTELDESSKANVLGSLDSIDYRGQLTNSPAAIERAIYELKGAAREGIKKVVIFMTDGIVDTGNADADTERAKWLREDLASDAAENEIAIFGIAFTENADFFLIQSLANQTGAEYRRAPKPEDLEQAFADFRAKLAEPPPPIEVAPPAAAAPTPAPASNCLDLLLADERLAIEESAAELGMTPERLCRETTQAGAGQVIVVPPPGESQESDNTLIAALVAGLVILAGLILLVVLLGRRKGGAVAAEVAVDVPEAYLSGLGDLSAQDRFKLGPKPIVVGRVKGADAQTIDYFVVPQNTVGRRHAMIKYRDFSFWISDLESVNGTFLNGERIEGERQLKHGDVVRFHKAEFEFAMPEMEDAGHTVFADPNETVAAMATANLDAPISAGDEEDLFDDDDEDDPHESPTLFSEKSSGGTNEDDEFDTSDLPDDDEDDDDGDGFFDDDAEIGEATNEPISDEDFEEAETLMPSGDVYDEIGEPTNGPEDLDDFMSFGDSDPGAGEADATELPMGAETIFPSEETELPRTDSQIPALDDVFDITGENAYGDQIPAEFASDEDPTIAPSSAKPDGDDDEDSEAPTIFKT